MKIASKSILAATLALLPALLSAQDLKIAMESRLSNLDPIVSGSHQTRDHGYLIYDTLLALDENQQIQPQMVDSYEVSDDGKTYTFTLRDGLKWHDGAPVTSADAVASINRWGQRDRMGQMLMSIVSEMTVVDDKTFSVTMSEASSVILDAFAKPSGVALFVMPERVANTPISEAITDYTGSGPFKFVADRFEPGSRAYYVKNEDYVPRSEPASWFAGGKVAHVDSIERIEMPDPLTAINALNGGEIDYLQTIPFDLMPMVPDGGDVHTDQLDQIGYQIGYRFNQLQQPFDDKMVRQAAMYAIGQEDSMLTQFGDPKYFTLCGAAFGCDLPYESDVMAEVVVDSNIEKAKELLEQSDYDGETVLIFHVTDLTSMSSIPLVMAQQLESAGFTVELQSMDFMTMLSRRANKGPVADGGWSIFVTSWHNIEISDPLRSFMISAAGDEGYAGWASVPEIEELRQSFLRAESDEERKAITADIQKLTYENGVFAPLGSFARISGFGPGISGALRAPANVFWNIKKNEG